MRFRIPQFERPSLALLAVMLVAIVPASAWAVGMDDDDEEPNATTSAAAAIGPTSATLSGTVDPNSRSTNYAFIWGPTTSYGSSSPTASAGNGSSPRPVSTLITGLASSTTYHFRIVATNSQGTDVGSDRTFTTLPPPPLATTGTVGAVDETSATLNAEINPNGSATTYRFDVGLTAEYGSRWPGSDAPVGSDGLPHALQEVLSGLLPGTTYHYRAVATNASGVTYGADQTFTTAGVPPPPGGGAPAPTDALPPATTPVLGQSATIAAVSGTVLVELPGTDHSLSLDDASTVPVGTKIDASAGTVRMTNVRDRSGKLQRATFWGGSFSVRQARSKQAPTVLTLTAPLTCPKSKSARHTASLAAKAPRARQLWGHDNNGRFVTRGRSAVATVRGTVWLLRDTCAGTLVKVTRGEVAVRDLVRKRTVIVNAGHNYLARTR